MCIPHWYPTCWDFYYINLTNMHLHALYPTTLWGSSCLSLIVFGWQTDGTVPNTLVIANCEIVKPRVAAAEYISAVILLLYDTFASSSVIFLFLFFGRFSCEAMFVYFWFFIMSLFAQIFSSMKKHVHPLLRSIRPSFILERYVPNIYASVSGYVWWWTWIFGCLFNFSPKSSRGATWP